ncbi:MAG: histidine--tRNA ligase [Candidatus Omnitrophica bacterium]|nr:histidine--tRNA ligase [Candidatus Omnitrophota bacterium]
MAFQALRGTTDILPGDVSRWSAVEQTARRLAFTYGYQELRTPILEDVGLFLRSIGETTDIVQKEMFRFEDRGGHEIVLRPEGTAAVVRAYLEHHLHKTEGFAKLFYLGPMFRAERPQAGRYRQFHQYGVEAIGSASAWVDVEVILLCVRILRDCGVADAVVWLSSMGCRQDQERSAALLRERLTPDRAALCQDCQARFDRNIFRVLDCKQPACQKLARQQLASLGHRPGFPATPFVLCDDCAAHFDVVRRGLRDAGVAFDDTQLFARGLDYYTRTVFEVRAKGLGAQDAVAAGGRYDHLVEELGGPSVGAMGFAAGIERVLMASASRPEKSSTPDARRGVYVAMVPPVPLVEGFRLVQRLRERGARAVMDYDQKSLKAQLREADKYGCRLVAILGEAELKQRAIALKDLEQGAQETVSLESFVDEAARRLGTAATECRA